MWQVIKLFFSYSASEQRRIVILILFAIILVSINRIYLNYSSEKLVQDEKLLTYLQTKTSDFNTLSLADDFSEPYIETEVFQAKSKPNKLNPFNFNPNSITHSGWEQLGFSEKETKMIMNFRSKLKNGFEYKEQLSKVFCINEDRYNQLESFIQLPSKTEFYTSKTVNSTSNKEANKTYEKFEKPASVIVEINGADTIELTKIRGIGPSFARGIYKYREKLGGFYEKEQLLEVFRITDSIYQAIAPQIIVDESLLRKININQATEQEMFAHPYFRNGIGKAIFNYRKQHGDYKRMEDLNKLRLLDEAKIRKIKPYITLE
jgi:competence protein ComEA